MNRWGERRLIRSSDMCWMVLAAVLFCLAGPVLAEADPPGRVGRVADLQGRVSLYDADQGGWTEAQRNRPLTSGDRLSLGRDARVELRIGSTSVKLAESSELELVRVDDERVQLLLHRGSAAIRLRSREVAGETEFGTPEALLQPSRGGLYRIDREDDTSYAQAWRGELRLLGESGAETIEIDSGRRVQLWREGRSLRHRFVAVPDDSFAARVLREDRDDERSASVAHVSPEMTGWEDLDRNGRWDQHPDYGPVWFPASVASNWAPYRYGRWVWVRPWGWTWVDDAPWGFAPFHYGRWASWNGRWCWVPGPYAARPVFSPGLVAWVDGPGFSVGVRGGGPSYAWLPLAPWDAYRPQYRASPRHQERINEPDLRRWRPGYRSGVTYGNQGVPNGVTTVPADVLKVRPPLIVDPNRDGRDRRDWRDGRDRPDGRDGRDGRDSRDDPRRGEPRRDPQPVTPWPRPEAGVPMPRWYPPTMSSNPAPVTTAPVAPSPQAPRQAPVIAAQPAPAPAAAVTTTTAPPSLPPRQPMAPAGPDDRAARMHGRRPVTESRPVTPPVATAPVAPPPAAVAGPPPAPPRVPAPAPPPRERDARDHKEDGGRNRSTGRDGVK